MTPVEIPREAGRTVRVRFIRNTSYAGVDYGPSFKAQEAEVRGDWARHFIRTGKAVRVQVAEDVPADPDALPDGFPGGVALAKAGISTFTALADAGPLTEIPGIGARTAGQIEARLRERDADG